MSEHPPSSSAGAERGSVRTAAILFAVAWVVRLLFLHAGPGTDWPHSVHYKGDALVWMQSVLASRSGEVFEFGLPFRPPGTAWLIDSLWDGTAAGHVFVLHAWTLLGALCVALFYWALAPWCGRRAAALAGGLACLSQGWMVLATSLNNETPYLFLFLLSMALAPAGPAGLPRARLAGWGALQALACLVRVEHALFTLLVLAAAAWKGRRAPRRAAVELGTAVGALVLVLVPWHVVAWGRVARFNRGELTRADPSVARIEAQFQHVRWTPEALRAAEELPAFLRKTATVFVTMTQAHRGERVVDAGDLAILREAYGVELEPVNARPFIASYGPLNFYLANHPGGDGGFDRGPLTDEPPPLAGGAHRYPPPIVSAMPPQRFSLEYPPHLHLFNHGYSASWREIRADFTGWLRLVGRKVAIFWSGATLGFTGLGLPLAGEGVRRSVDLFVPSPGVRSSLWGVALLALAVVGFAGTRRSPERATWALYGLSKLAVCALFFGYARQGVLFSPVLLAGVALGVERLLRGRLARPGAWLVLAWLWLGAGTAVELARYRVGVRAWIDGAAVGEVDPVPGEEHEDRRIRFGWGR